MPKNPNQADEQDGTTEEMLPMDPPPIAARLLATLMILIFLIVGFVSIFVPLPETVRTPFVLISANGSDPVESRIFGVVEGVHVDVGDPVRRGDALFTLQSDEIRTWRLQLAIAQEDLRTLRDKGLKSVESFEKRKQIFEKMQANANEELQYNLKYLEHRQKLSQGMSNLWKEGVVSDVEMDAYKMNEEWSMKNVLTAQKTVEQTSLELERLETEREREIITERAQIENLEEKVETLEDQLTNCGEDTLNVLAPYEAVITELPNRNSGSVVHQGDVLCQLSAVDDELVAELQLAEDSLPKLRTGLGVRYFLDAFPYQRYGTITGRVDWISPATVQTTDIAQFIANTTLATNQITIGKTNINGKVVNIQKPLQVGMTGQARINVGTRTLIEFAFEPIKQLRENMRTD